MKAANESVTDDALAQLEALGWTYHSTELRDGLDVVIVRRDTGRGEGPA